MITFDDIKCIYTKGKIQKRLGYYKRSTQESSKDSKQERIDLKY